MPMVTKFVHLQKTYEKLQPLKLHNFWLVMTNEILSPKQCSDEKVQARTTISSLFE